MSDTDTARTAPADLPGARPARGRVKHPTAPPARWLRGVGEEFISLSVPVAAAVLVFAPPALAVIVGCASGVNCLMALLQVVHAYTAGQYNAVVSDLPALSSDAKIASACLAYLALIYALCVLISGMIGRQQHWYLVPGILLTLPTLAAYTVAAYLLIRMLSAGTAWGNLPFVILFSYAGFDAVVLGLLATDLRPVTSRRRRRILAVPRAARIRLRRK